MYRYSVDNTITYTSEDLVLFKESPFASWMERLTLENPQHGIPPDMGSSAPGNTMQRQDEFAETLHAENRAVALIDWNQPEPLRRSATLAAMRNGADFIVNGQLALGPVSGSANLLMRTSGFSELGDFLYIPCDTQAKTNLHSAFRLCFLADLLHSLQGQLPPQMLIIRGSHDLVPLQTEDHIYHYRAVKQRFMLAQLDFRKHKMPDPAASSHFGRWADCANEVLKQRALAQAPELGSAPLATAESEPELTLQASQPMAAAGGAELAREPALAPHVAPHFAPAAAIRAMAGDQAGTLVEQARQMNGNAVAVSGAAGGSKNASLALQSLSFIGSAHSATAPSGRGQSSAPDSKPANGDNAPERRRAGRLPELQLGARDDYPPHMSPTPTPSPSPSIVDVDASSTAVKQSHPLDSPGFSVSARSIIDRDTDHSDGAARVSREPADRAPAGASRGYPAGSGNGGSALEGALAQPAAQREISVHPFSDSLLTSQDFPD